MLTAEDNPYVKVISTADLGSDIRLHVYEPDGTTTRGIISDALEIEVYDRLGQTPTLTVKVTDHAESTRHLLKGPCIVAVEVMVVESNDLKHFVHREYRNMRFVILDISHDRSLANDPTDTYTIKGAGLFHLFEGARVLLDPQRDPDNDDEGEKAEKRQFIDTTPGAIIWTLFEEAKARQELLPLGLGFTSQKDSFGNDWPTTSREYSPSTSLLTVISNMLESGLAEFWMMGNVLHMSLIGEWDRHYRQPTLPVPYIRDLTPDSAPETIAYTDMVSRVLLIGDEGFTREKYINPDPVLMPFGGRTMVIEAGGVKTNEDADRMINRALVEGAGPRRTYTRDWTYAGDQSPMGFLPFRDFNPGDWLDCDIDGEPRATMQVQDMSLKRTNGELKASVTLGSLYDDLLTRLARQAQGLADGAVVASTGRPKPVAGGGEYDAHPGQKMGLKLTDKAGGLKAYGKKRVPALDNTGNPIFRTDDIESVSVDKDTGAVAMNGVVKTGTLAFGNVTDPATLKVTPFGFSSDSFSTDLALAEDDPGVVLNMWGGAGTSIVHAANGRAVLGIAANNAISRGVQTPFPSDKDVAGIIVSRKWDGTGTNIDMQANEVVIRAGRTRAEYMEMASARTGDLTVKDALTVGDRAKTAATVNNIAGVTTFYDNVTFNVDVTITGKLDATHRVNTPSTYFKGSLYQVYVDDTGRLYKARRATPVTDVRAA